MTMEFLRNFKKMTNIPIRKLDDCRILMKSDEYGIFQELDDHRICIKFLKDSDQNSNLSIQPFR